MANRLISAATGNFTTNTTWKTASAVANSMVDSEAFANLNISTGNSDSASFVPAATQIDAIVLKIASIITPTGTLTVKLRNSTTSTDAATVTINASDLNANALGYHVFSFSPVTPNGTDSYIVRVTRSVVDGASNRISLYTSSSASATNMTRMVRLVTNNAPASGDQLIIAGEFTGAGTSNSYTVTMDNTATTSFGSISDPQGIALCDKGTLTWGTAASTNYYLKYKGLFKFFPGSTINVGTTGTPMPSTSTAVIEMDTTNNANMDTGITSVVGSTINIQGNALTYDRAILSADAAASATSLTTDVSTAWLNGDNISIAATSRTASEAEKKSLSANASGTTLTISAITNAHSGSSPVQAELLNLTRNIIFRGVDTSHNGYIDIQGGTWDVDWAEFYNIGSSTTNKKGIDVRNTAGSTNFNRCSFHDFQASTNSRIEFSTTAVSSTFTNNVGHGFGYGMFFHNGGSTSPVITGNICNASQAHGMLIYSLNPTFTGNIVSGSSSNGFYLSANSNSLLNSGTYDTLKAHSNASAGFNILTVTGLVATNLTANRNGSIGYNLSGDIDRCSFTTLTANGNALAHIQFAGCRDTIVDGLTCNSEASFVSNYGIYLAASNPGTKLVNSSINATTGAGNADVAMITKVADLIMHNTTLGSTTEIAAAYVNNPGYIIYSQKHDQTAGNHKTFSGVGTVTSDTTIYNNASPSSRMTPSNATLKLRGAIKSVAVNSGDTVTVTVYVRKSAAGDGTAYTGNQPRLLVRRNDATGITADTVLATASAATGSWEQLTGVTAAASANGAFEFFVDCDGTAGWVNVDDWATTTQNDGGTNKYWIDGQPQISITNLSKGIPASSGAL